MWEQITGALESRCVVVAVPARSGAMVRWISGTRGRMDVLFFGDGGVDMIIIYTEYGCARVSGSSGINCDAVSRDPEELERF